MELAAVFPTTQIGRDPDDIVSWARSAEKLGYSHIVAFDHVLGAVHGDRHPPLWGPYDETVPFFEPLVLFSHLAALTKKIGLMTGVLVLPQRPTALVAKQVADLDILSRGRVRLGVGVGWNWVEYEAMGAQFTGRGDRLEEQLSVLRQLWQQAVVTIDSPNHHIDRAGLMPKPERAIPIWMGGFVDAAFQRAAKLADGFVFSSMSVETARQQVGRLRGHLSDAGRDPVTFPIELSTAWCQGLDSVRRLIELAHELQVTAISVNTMSTTAQWSGWTPAVELHTPDEHIAALEQFRAEAT